MSSSSKAESVSISTPPKDMALAILPLQQVAQILADQHSLPAGKYALVVEYKLGNTILKDTDDSPIPGMAIAIGGIGLKEASSDGPMTFDYAGKGKKKSSATGKAKD